MITTTVYLWLCLAFFSFHAALSATLLAIKADESARLRLVRCVVFMAEICMSTWAWVLLP